MSGNRIKILEELSFNQLEPMLREINLKDNQNVKPYAEADFSIQTFPPDFVRPVGSYVVTRNLKFQDLLRQTLQREYKIDTLIMEGGRSVKIQFNLPDKTERLLIPTFVEVSHYDGGLPIVMDGQHRLYLAMSKKIPHVNSIVARNVIVPYYGYPLPNGWADVEQVSEVPHTGAKRRYRISTPLGSKPLHYSLYRDFEPLKVGKPRSKNDDAEIDKLIKFMEDG